MRPERPRLDQVHGNRRAGSDRDGQLALGRRGGQAQPVRAGQQHHAHRHNAVGRPGAGRAAALEDRGHGRIPPEDRAAALRPVGHAGAVRGLDWRSEVDFPAGGGEKLRYAERKFQDKGLHYK